MKTLQFRLADSVQTAFYESQGDCIVELCGRWRKNACFSDRFELDGMQFEEPSVNLFTFNNPYGACKTCEGFGQVLGIDPDLVIPDKSLSVYEGAVAPWRSDASMQEEWLQAAAEKRHQLRFSRFTGLTTSLRKKNRNCSGRATATFDGINAFFNFLQQQARIKSSTG